MLGDTMELRNTESGGSLSGKAVESGKVWASIQSDGVAACVHILLYFSSEKEPENLPLFFH